MARKVLNIFKYLIPTYFILYSNIMFGAEKSNEGMPQLDVATYPSLIFWLVLTFSFTFFVLKYYVTPKMSEILNDRKEKIDADLFKAKQSREDAENSKMNQEKSISDAKEKAIIIVRDAVEKSKSKLLISESKAKVKLSKKLEDAEKNILNAKKDSLKIVNEIASDIAIIISDKISGIKIGKNLILKSVNDKIKESS
jgi:F-type H+-transporting ATPase subunit b